MKKVLTVLGIMLIILFVLTIEAQAFTYNVKLQPEKTELKHGDTVKVDVDISSISLETSEAGIISFNAKLDYDDEIFSKVTAVGQENWSGVITYSPSSKTLTGFIVSLESEVREAGTVATITLTVADTAKVEDTTVTLKDVKLSNGVSDAVTTSDASVKFTVVEVVDDGNTDDGNVPGTGDNSGNEDNNPGDGNNQGNGNDNTGDGNNQGSGNNNTGSGNNNQSSNNNNAGNNRNNNTTNTNKDNTIANKVISAAGLENISAIVVGALVVIAGISYMSYKKYKNM